MIAIPNGRRDRVNDADRRARENAAASERAAAAARENAARMANAQVFRTRKEMQTLLVEVNERLDRGGFPDPVLVRFRAWGRKRDKGAWLIGEIGVGWHYDIEQTTGVFLLSDGRVAIGISGALRIESQEWLLGYPKLANGLRSLLDT